MELDMEIGEGQPQGCPFFGDGSDDFGESTLPVCLQSQTPGISQAVPPAAEMMALPQNTPAISTVYMGSPFSILRFLQSAWVRPI